MAVLGRHHQRVCLDLVIFPLPHQDYAALLQANNLSPQPFQVFQNGSKNGGRRRCPRRRRRLPCIWPAGCIMLLQTRAYSSLIRCCSSHCNHIAALLHRIRNPTQAASRCSLHMAPCISRTACRSKATSGSCSSLTVRLSRHTMAMHCSLRTAATCSQHPASTAHK